MSLYFRDKPTTLFISGTIIALAIVDILVETILASSGILPLVNGNFYEGFSLAVLLPFLVGALIEIGIYVFVGVVVIRGIYRWSKGAIIAGAIIAPVAFLFMSAMALTRFGLSIDFDTAFGILYLMLIAFLPLISGVVAYRDIKYRLPNVQKNY